MRWGSGVRREQRARRMYGGRRPGLIRRPLVSRIKPVPGLRCFPRIAASHAWIQGQRMKPSNACTLSPVLNYRPALKKKERERRYVVEGEIEIERNRVGTAVHWSHIAQFILLKPFIILPQLPTCIQRRSSYVHLVGRQARW